METPSSNPALLAVARADAAWRREQARALVWRALPWFSVGFLAACGLDAFFQLGLIPRVALLALGVVLGPARSRPSPPTGSGCGAIPPSASPATSKTGRPSLAPGSSTRSSSPAQSADPRLPAIDPHPRRPGGGDATRPSSMPPISRALPAPAPIAARWSAPCLVGGALVLGLVFYPVMGIVVPRFLDPFGDHPPYAFTRVEIAQPLADGSPVVYGGTLAVRADWAGHEPRELYLTAHPPERPAEAVTVPMIREAKTATSPTSPTSAPTWCSSPRPGTGPTTARSASPASCSRRGSSKAG